MHIAAELKDFDAHDHMDKRCARRMDDFSRYAVAAARMAQQESGLDVAAEPDRIGAVIGTGVGGVTTFQNQIDAMREKGADRINPLFIPTMIPNMAAGQVSLELGTKGPLTAVCTACAARGNAIGDASEVIRRGDAEVMFAGGTEAPICTIGVGGFAAKRALSRATTTRAGASRPFDLDRDGFVMGEGAGVLVLEDLEHARRAGRVSMPNSSATAESDSFHLTLPDGTGESQARAMTMALAKAGFAPTRSSTSTPTAPARSWATTARPRPSRTPSAATRQTGDLVDKVHDRTLPRRQRRHRGGRGVLTIDRGVIHPTIN